MPPNDDYDNRPAHYDDDDPGEYDSPAIIDVLRAALDLDNGPCPNYHAHYCPRHDGALVLHGDPVDRGSDLILGPARPSSGADPGQPAHPGGRPAADRCDD